MTRNLILSFALILMVSFATQAQPFGPQNNLSNFVQSPTDIEIIDLDKDGDLDILTIDAGNESLLWYENLDSFTFIEHRLTDEGRFFGTNIEVSDLDNDGDLDIISIATRTPAVVVHENLGNKRFKYVVLDSRDRAFGLATGDWDQDGYEDIFYTTNDQDGTIIGLRNEGNLSFSKDTIATEVGSQCKIFTEDFNNDSIEDIIFYAHRNWKSGTLINNNGTFQRNNYNSTLNEIWDITFKDVNDDGYIDMIPSFNQPSLLAYSWFENDSENLFNKLGFSDVYPLAACPIDVDNDSDYDIVIFDSRGTTLWFDNLGDGSFKRDTVEGVHSSYNFIKIADMNNNGLDDIVGFNRTSGEISILINNNNGSFERKLIATNTDVYQPSSIFTHDLNQDGLDEIYGYSDKSNSVIRFPKTEGGVLPGAKIFDLGNYDSDYSAIYDLEFSDMTGDSLVDALIVTFLDGEGQFVLFKNEGDMEFSFHPIPLPVTSITAIDLVDLNNDGKTDIPSVSRGEDKIGILIDTGQYQYSYELLSDKYTRPLDIHVNDIDLDGDPDLICFYGDPGGNVVIFENTDSGFVDNNTFSGSYLTDLDKDGDIDILSGLNSRSVLCHYNDGAGNFSPENLGGTGGHENDVLFASDLDNDGDLDIISGTSNLGANSQVVYLINNGDGTFIPYKTLNTDISVVQGISASDLDLDGDQEIMVASGNKGDFTWYENLHINCLAHGQDHIISACNSYTIQTGETITASTMFTDSIYNGFGCDSIIYYDINITNIDTSVLQYDNTLEVVHSNNIQIRWVDCDDNYAAVPGETSAVFEVTSSGNYAVIITREECEDTSACFYVQPTSVKSGDRNDKIQVYPNPATNHLTVKGVTGTAQIMITDVSGKTLLETSTSQPQFNISLEGLNQGLYFLRVKENNERERVRPFVKE